MAVVFSGKSPQMMIYPVIHHFRVQLAVGGKGSVDSIGSWKKEDEDDEDGIQVCDLRISIPKQGTSL